MNLVWSLLLMSGLFTAMIENRAGAITTALVGQSEAAVDMAIGFIGIMTFWLGVAKVAEESGLIAALSQLMAPLIRPLFPSVPSGHPALGTLSMNITANVLGLGSAATPFGLKAMEDLKSLKPDTDEATDAMCTFLALNTSSVTLIPTTVIAIRAAAGSANPTEIVATTLFATSVSTAVALTADALLRRLGGRRG